MDKVSILNSSDAEKVVKALENAAKASPKNAKAIKALAQSLGETKQRTAGRARRNKGDASMAKQTTKRATTRKATRRRRTRTNPTAAAAAPSTGWKHRAKSGFKRGAARAKSHIGSKLSQVNVMNLAVRGACVAGGFLVQSMVARQSEKFLPSLPRVAHHILSAGVIAAAAIMLAGGKQWAEDIAVSSVAGGLKGLAHEFAPGVFAGLHEADVYNQGFQDGGQYQAYAGLAETDEYGNEVGYVDAFNDDGQVQGLAFSGKKYPEDIPTRPKGF